MIERIPPEAREYFDGHRIETVYFPKDRLANEWLRIFAKEHPFFEDLKELESALKEYEVIHGFEGDGTFKKMAGIRSSPIVGEDPRYVFAKISPPGRWTHSPLKFIINNSHDEKPN